MKQQLDHKHYIAQSNRLSVLENFKGKEGFFIKAFFINDQVNGNKWRVTWDAIKQDMSAAVGQPIVTLEDLDHPSAAVQDFFAKGIIIDYELIEAEHKAVIIARIFDKEIQDGIRDGTLKFVSPAVVPRDNLSVEKIDGIDVLSRFITLHLAIVSRPAYGKSDARMKGICTGTGEFCMNYLQPLKASVTQYIPIFAAAQDKPSTDVQTVIFDKDKFNLDRAKKWLKTHDFKVPAVDETDDSFRFRQKEPGTFKEESFRTIELTEGVKSVIGRPKTASDGDSAIQKVGPLTQIPFLVKKKKMKAQIAYIASLQDQITHHAPYTVHDGKEGEWFMAKDTWMFVARDQSVDAAIKEQCPCSTS